MLIWKLILKSVLNVTDKYLTVQKFKICNSKQSTYQRKNYKDIWEF